MADFGIGETLFTLIDALETAGPALGAAGTAAGGAAAAGAFSGGSSAVAGSATPATGGAPSATGSTTSAGTGGEATTPKPGFFGNIVKAAGPAIAGGVASSAASQIFGGKRGVSIPPPPGAAMIDPAGAQAAAMIRARQAIAGGLGSTISPGAGSQPAYTGATSGGKTLLGQ